MIARCILLMHRGLFLAMPWPNPRLGCCNGCQQDALALDVGLQLRGRCVGPRWRLDQVATRRKGARQQFDAALDNVHEYFRKNGASLRAAQDLDRGRGPTDASQRQLPCVDYVGRPARFAFFSASLFAAALREAGFSNVELATEAAYDAALQAVNDLMHNHALARNLPAELRYRGPQCWSQRRDVARARAHMCRRLSTRRRAPRNDRDRGRCGCMRSWGGGLAGLNTVIRSLPFPTSVVGARGQPSNAKAHRTVTADNI